MGPRNLALGGFGRDSSWRGSCSSASAARRTIECMDRGKPTVQSCLYELPDVP